MRIPIIVTALLLSSSIKSQIIGDTFSTVKQLINEPPCEVDRNLILYCLNNNDKIAYGFNSQGHVCQITKFISAYSYRESQSILENKVNELKREFNVEPYIRDGKYTFYYNDSHSIMFFTTSNENEYFLVEVEFDYDLSLK